MDLELNRLSYFVIAAIGGVGILQAILTKGDGSSFRDRDRRSNPLITWPAWFQRLFYLCVGLVVLVFAAFKLYYR
jgi:hypothetical protein